MKRIKFFSLFLFLYFLNINVVLANNIIYRIDVTVNLNSDGTGNITEVWDAYTNHGTEFYQPMSIR